MASRALSSVLALVAATSCHATSASPEGPQQALDAAPAPTAFEKRCGELGLSRAECTGWTAVVLPEALPESKGNRFADDLGAAELGFALFFDSRALAGEQPVRCASCHEPEHAFAQEMPLPVGVGLSRRNAPAVTNSARTHPHFWDGRADSLFTQPLMTIENEDEMNGTRLGVAHSMAGAYRARYEKVFGPLPDLSDRSRFPARGKPGSPEWEGMTAEDRRTINRIYSNVGKALEAYDRKISTGRSAVDRFILGDLDALTPEAQSGMVVFTTAGCQRCHSGPALTDGRYHALDLPPPAYVKARLKTQGDRGRAEGIEVLLASEFNSLSEYYDRKPGEPVEMSEDTSAVADAAFLTPSLRNVGDTRPYSHTGVFNTLEEIIRFKIAGGGPACKELPKVALSEEEIQNLVTFLHSLHGDTAPLPWSFWPPIGGGAPAYDAGAGRYDAAVPGGSSK